MYINVYHISCIFILYFPCSSGRFPRIRTCRRRASPPGLGSAARRPGRTGRARPSAVPRGAAAGGPAALEAGDVRDALCLGGRRSRMISWENRGKWRKMEVYMANSTILIFAESMISRIFWTSTTTWGIYIGFVGWWFLSKSKVICWGKRGLTMVDRWTRSIWRWNGEMDLGWRWWVV